MSISMMNIDSLFGLLNDESNLTTSCEHRCLTWNSRTCPALTPPPSLEQVPHLEQPEVTAAAIIAWVRGEDVAGDGDAASLTERKAPLDQLRALYGALWASAEE